MQLLVSESADLDDPMGVATLTVERSTGFNGEIVVYWEVEDDGLDDLEPAGGNLTFADVSYNGSLNILVSHATASFCKHLKAESRDVRTRLHNA